VEDRREAGKWERSNPASQLSTHGSQPAKVENGLVSVESVVQTERSR